MKKRIPAIICDLDGTLALMNGRDPYDATTCDQDLLNEPIAAIINQFSLDIYETKILCPQIIFCSGRMDRYKKPTEAFIKKHFPNLRYKLFMRKTDDWKIDPITGKRYIEKDSIIKREIYEQHIAPDYDVLFVLDDRNQVVDMWRELGLTCLQVAPGDF